MARRAPGNRRQTRVREIGRPAGDHEDRNVVKRGGIAKSEADISDVSRDTYGTPIGPGGTASPATPLAEPAVDDENDRPSPAVNGVGRVHRAGRRVLPVERG
jgi:hypothetical protein